MKYSGTDPQVYKLKVSPPWTPVNIIKVSLDLNAMLSEKLQNHGVCREVNTWPALLLKPSSRTAARIIMPVQFSFGNSSSYEVSIELTDESLRTAWPPTGDTIYYDGESVTGVVCIPVPVHVV